jgi:hypothetical protein
MAFNIINKAASNKKVTWKFETLDRVFTSDLERFKRNVSYWKEKLQIGADVQVELLEGGQFLYDFLQEEKNIVDVEHTDVTEEPQIESRLEENEHTIAIEPAIESRVDESDAQPSVSEVTESPIDTDKPKRRKKAV